MVDFTTTLPLEDETPTATEPAEEPQVAAARAASSLTFELPEPQAAGAPPWATVPTGMRFPRGKQVMFVRFKSVWTDAPWKGESFVDPVTQQTELDARGKPVLWRQCVVWPINTADKTLALERARRDPNRAPDELTKQMIRAIDGVEVDWAVVRGNGIEMFWNELGEGCRGLLTRLFTRLHVLNAEAVQDFLETCIEVRTTAG